MKWLRRMWPWLRRILLALLAHVVAMGSRLSAYGPTPHHLESFRLAEEEFAAIRDGLNQVVRVDLPALEEKLEAAGVPWTPGRGVPE